MIGKIVLFLELVISFGLLFWWIRRESIIHNLMHRAYDNLEQAAKRREEDSRRGMLLMKRRKGLLYHLEQQLLYSGLTRKLPFLTPELWITGNLVLVAPIYTIGTILGGNWWLGFLLVLIFEVFIYLMQNLLLLKFLDFLGNYSITSREVTIILKQISAYLEEPLRSVLEECYYEAQTSGDTGIALLSMAEKVQHPKFKELVRNIEISMRYSADFTILVSQSRKSIREHMRMRQEQKALASEAWVNILILGAMTVIILKTVEVLIGVPIQDILFETWVGRGCMAGIMVILFLFYQKIRKLDK